MKKLKQLTKLKHLTTLPSVLMAATGVAIIAVLPSHVRAEPAAVLETITITSSDSGDTNAARSATRSDTPLRELPQSVQVLSRQVIDDLNATRLDDLLPQVSGVAMQSNFGGLWDNYSIRGFSGSIFGGMNILLNGFPGNRGYSAARDMANVEQIDFLKGPAAALYGSSEPGGTINIVTKKPKFKAANALDVSTDSNGSYRSAIDLTGPINERVAFRLNAMAEHKNTGRDHVTAKRELLAPAITWFLTENTILNYEAEITRQRVPFDRGIVAVNGKFGMLPSSRFLGEPNDGDVSLLNQVHQLTLEHTINSNWRIRTGLSRKDGSMQGFSSEASFLQADTLQRQRRYRDLSWHDTAVQAELAGKFNTGSIGHAVLIGMEANWLTNNQRMLIHDRNIAYPINIYHPVYGQAQPTPLPAIDMSERQIGSALFIQDQLSLSQRWKFLAGARFDTFRSTINNLRSNTYSAQRQSATSPRVGLTYLANQSVSLYMNAGKSFRPNMSDLAGNSFDPETALAYEAGMKFASIDQRINASVAVFDITKHNVLTSNPVNPMFQIAAGAVNSRGIEADFNGKMGRHWRMLGNITYTDARVTKDNKLAVGARLVNVPRLSASALAIYEAATSKGGIYGLGGGANYVGVRSGDAVSSFDLPEYVTAKLLAYWQFTPKMRLSLNIDNLFNKQYYASSFSNLWVAPGNQRTATLALNVKF